MLARVNNSMPPEYGDMGRLEPLANPLTSPRPRQKTDTV
jgi:hypothetical protein